MTTPLPTFDPQSERVIATLLPAAQKAARLYLQAANAELTKLRSGLVAHVISGLRTFAEQDALYAQGRTAHGSIVTNAKAGQSWHNYGIAFDIGLFNGATYLGDSPLYKTLGPVGEALGLEWGGSWSSIVDMPHYQLKIGLTLEQALARHNAGESILDGTPYAGGDFPAGNVAAAAGWTLAYGSKKIEIAASETATVRAVAELLGATVDADGAKRIITLTMP